MHARANVQRCVQSANAGGTVESNPKVWTAGVTNQLILAKTEVAASEQASLFHDPDRMKLKECNFAMSKMSKQLKLPSVKGEKMTADFAWLDHVIF